MIHNSIFRAFLQKIKSARYKPVNTVYDSNHAFKKIGSFKSAVLE